MSKKPRIQILIPLVVILISTIGLFAAYHYSLRKSTEAGISALQATISSRLNFIQVTSEQFIQINAPEYVQQSISSLAAEKDLVLALVTDGKGNVIASTQYFQVGQPWRDILATDLSQRLMPILKEHRPQIWQQGKHLIGVSPICPNTAGKLKQCGFVYYEASLATYRYPLLRLMSGYTIFTLITLIFVGAVATLLVQRLLTTPINQINKNLRRFANGERDIHINALPTYEMEKLGESIDFLLQSIVANEENLMESEEKMRTIINTVAGAIITINHRGIIENFNPGAENLFGYRSAEVVGKNVSMLMPEPDKGQHDGYINNYLNGNEAKIIGKGRETNAIRKDGTVFPIHLTVSETKIRGQIFFTGIVIDLTEQKKITNALSAVNRELFTTNLALKESARIDAMTGLYNRAHFNSNIETELNRATRYKYPVSIIMCDIDYFKRYNDYYGHLQGDTCIAEVAQIIKETFSRSGEIAARYGGEEFIIIVPNMAVDEVMERAEHLRRSIFSRKLEHKNSEVTEYVTISVGVSSYDPYQTTLPPKAKALIDAADAALYQSKAEGRNLVSYMKFSAEPDPA